ncbi:MAG: hypothetical protein ACI9MS_002707 [Glaciecola sp.]|jgi:hypothetical protein
MLRLRQRTEDKISSPRNQLSAEGMPYGNDDISSNDEIP